MSLLIPEPCTTPEPCTQKIVARSEAHRLRGNPTPHTLKGTPTPYTLKGNPAPCTLKPGTPQFLGVKHIVRVNEQSLNPPTLTLKTLNPKTQSCTTKTVARSEAHRVRARNEPCSKQRAEP